MDSGSMEIGGVLLRSPMTAATNLLLAIQCGASYLALRRQSSVGNAALLPPRPARPRPRPPRAPSPPRTPSSFWRTPEPATAVAPTTLDPGFRPDDELPPDPGFRRDDELRADPGWDDELRRNDNWGRFFLLLAISNLAGAPKHAFSAYSGTAAHVAVVLASNLAAGLATYFGQRAALSSAELGRGGERAVIRLAKAQLLTFGLVILRYRHFTPVVINSGAGLAVTLLLEARAAARRSPGAGWRIAGLCSLALPGLAYVWRVPAGPAFDHIDLAHLLMMPGLLLVLVGALRLRDDDHRKTRASPGAP